MSPVMKQQSSKLNNTVVGRESPGTPLLSPQMSDARRSLNAAERMSYSALRGMNRTEHLNKYILEGEAGNKYKVSTFVPGTVSVYNAIPFLRDNRNVSNRTFT